MSHSLRTSRPTVPTQFGTESEVRERCALLSLESGFGRGGVRGQDHHQDRPAEDRDVESRALDVGRALLWRVCK